MGHNLASQIQLRGESGAAGGIDMATGILGDLVKGKSICGYT